MFVLCNMVGDDFEQVIISNTEQAESLIAQATLKRATAMTNTNSQSR